MPKKEKCHYVITHGLLSSRCWRNTYSGSKFCIFHDGEHEKDIDVFNREIKKMLEEMPNFYDFVGFYFPKDFNFGVICEYLKNRTFKDTVNLSQATFQGRVNFIGVTFTEANFLDATFQDRAYFTNARFQEGANFEEATFQKIVSFIGTSFFTEELESLTIFRHAEFQDNASFRCAMFEEANFQNAIFEKMADFAGSTFIEANFQDAKFRDIAEFSYHKIEDKKRYPKFKIVDFDNAIFTKKANFEGCEIEEKVDFQNAEFQDYLLLIKIKGAPILDFRNTKFSEKTLIGIGTNLRNALFNYSRAELPDYSDAKWPKKENYRIYEERKKDIGYKISWKDLSSVYRKLKQAHQKYGHYDLAGRFYYREMECKKNALKEKRFSLDWFKSFGYSFLKHSCGYGEKPLRVMRNSLISVLGFAFAYFFTNSINLSGDSVPRNILQSIYFSTITFTTLGYGDIHPINDAGRVLAMSEAVLGAIFIALFIFVFGRKMMR